MTPAADPRSGSRRSSIQDLIDRARELFRNELAAPPAMTLRGGDAVDSDRRPEPWDAAQDEPTDAYLDIASSFRKHW